MYFVRGGLGKSAQACATTSNQMFAHGYLPAQVDYRIRPVLRTFIRTEQEGIFVVTGIINEKRQSLWPSPPVDIFVFMSFQLISGHCHKHAYVHSAGKLYNRHPFFIGESFKKALFFITKGML